MKWIEVKGQGGSLGSLIENENYHTSLFPGVVGIKNSADATFADIDFTGSTFTDGFKVEDATTKIKGTVTAKAADITLGSYDKKNYAGNEATLNIPATTDKLYANSIKEATTGHEDKVTSKVDNQGYVELPNGETDVQVDAWGGVKVNKEPDGGQQPIEVDVDPDGNYVLNLNQLDGKHAFTNVKSVTIEGTKTPNEDQYAILVTAMAGKELILSDNATLNLDNGNGTLSVNKLTVNGYAAIGYKESNPSVMLTVNTIEVAEDANFRVYESYIEVATELGVTSGYKGGVTIGEGGKIAYFKGGAIIAKSMTTPGAMLTWDVKTNEWK